MPWTDRPWSWTLATSSSLVRVAQEGRTGGGIGPPSLPVHGCLSRRGRAFRRRHPGGTQPGGYLQLLFQNPTGMPSAVAATAWTHSITCPAFKGAATLDALRAFRAAYINKGPEFIPVPE